MAAFPTRTPALPAKGFSLLMRTGGEAFAIFPLLPPPPRPPFSLNFFKKMCLPELLTRIMPPALCGAPAGDEDRRLQAPLPRHSTE